MLVSKLKTVAQILFVCLVLASLGFGLAIPLSHAAALASVTVLTLMSMGVYVRDWVQPHELIGDKWKSWSIRS